MGCGSSTEDVPKTQEELDKELWSNCGWSVNVAEVKRLVQLGANGAGYKDPQCGWTTLHKLVYEAFAGEVSSDEIECIDLLLQKMSKDGVLLKSTKSTCMDDPGNQTAKDMAVKGEKSKIVDLFVKHGY
eukprot:g3240.t1